MTDHGVVLELTGVGKTYAVPVLAEVDLSIRRGEVHALLGANGAGKSTLSRIIAGLVAPTAGNMRLDGQVFAPSSKRIAETAGVQIVQQELNLIPTLSVAENLLLTRLPRRFGLIDRTALHTQARTILDRNGLTALPTDVLVSALGVGQQQLLEIAGALGRECRVLILDEPTAALSVSEADDLLRRLDLLRAQGVAIIYISHRLDEVARLADRVTVLRDGRRVHTGAAKDLSTDAMVALMSGDEQRANGAWTSHATERVVLEASGFSAPPRLVDGGFSVRAGERLGIAGLVGSGRSELLRAVFGAERAVAGTLALRGKAVRFASPAQAVTQGLALITEERKRDGALLPLPVRSNTTLGSLPSRFGFVARAAEDQLAEDYRQRLDTRCTSIEQPIGALSGGNQQKVVIARWLARDADIYLFDEPTRGIDVAARRRIHQVFAELAECGKALVIVSSDLDELLEACDAVVVMSAGKMAGRFERATWSREAIMRAAFSHHLTTAVA
ncbi:MAG TPA: sugar ABC transporter ATP-binding protein [Planctomycetota bacterium]|jgi:ribose transport system ATP-binding protein|nr:sugar ABC transporter ATP-binding protein [Planctomycetota bacterium]